MFLEKQIIPLVQKLTQFKKCYISSCFTFAQIYKLQRYKKYNMHESVNNVSTNMNQAHSILPCLPHDGATNRCVS